MIRSVFNIPLSYPFLESLTKGLLKWNEEEKIDLTNTIIFMPTRRACEDLKKQLLHHQSNQTMLLPKLIPLGDLEAIEWLLLEECPLQTQKIPLPMPLRRRRFLLAQLIERTPLLPQHSSSELKCPTAIQAFSLAQDLLNVLDQFHTNQVPLYKINEIYHENLPIHAQLNLNFLKLLMRNWPLILKEENAADTQDILFQLLSTLSQHWSKNGSKKTIFVAGSTGSISATRNLIQTIAHLDKGHIVLSGLPQNNEVDDKSWGHLSNHHPLYCLQDLLKFLNLERSSVKEWPELEKKQTIGERSNLLHEIFRPQETISKWRELENNMVQKGIQNLHYFECHHLQQEALSIAFLLKETHHTQSQKAALITPHENLSMRVKTYLDQWNVPHHDTFGKTLIHTNIGALFNDILDCVEKEIRPSVFLSLLKNPLLIDNGENHQWSEMIHQLELQALRGPMPLSGFKGLKALINSDHPLQSFINDIEKLFSPLLLLSKQKKKISIIDHMNQHIHIAESLVKRARDRDDETGDGLLSDDNASHFFSFIDELKNTGQEWHLNFSEYVSIFKHSLAQESIYPVAPHDARIYLLPPLEARLLDFDRVIIGACNHNVWPPSKSHHFWLNQKMKLDLGLINDQKRTGLSAQDFLQACHKSEVFITRSLNDSGAPIMPSSWLMRLDNILEHSGHAENIRLKQSHEYGWIETFDAINVSSSPLEKIEAPSPCPPLKSRPKQLSVTEIETWLRDPYAIYAKHILKLKPLEPLEQEPGSAEYGSIIHDIFDQFMDQKPDFNNESTLDDLLSLGDQKLKKFQARPSIWIFWWPRFVRIAKWFFENEKERQNTINTTLTERKAYLNIKSHFGFMLKGRIDRIDILNNDQMEVIDYKTGAPPSTKEVKAGFAPQLPLEAALITHGEIEEDMSFKVDPSNIKLSYWRLKGTHPVAQITPIQHPTDELIEETLQGLHKLVHHYESDETTYLARPYPELAPQYSDYEHLSRVNEWYQ